MNPSGSCPSDPYTESRTTKTEAPKKNEPPTEAQKLKQFLEMDRKVLRFYCIWDDRDTPYGDIRKVILQVSLRWFQFPVRVCSGLLSELSSFNGAVEVYRLD